MKLTVTLSLLYLIDWKHVDLSFFHIYKAKFARPKNRALLRGFVSPFFQKKVSSQVPPPCLDFYWNGQFQKKEQGVEDTVWGSFSILYAIWVLYKIASGISRVYIKTCNVKFLRDDQEKIMWNFQRSWF